MGSLETRVEEIFTNADTNKSYSKSLFWDTLYWKGKAEIRTPIQDDVLCRVVLKNAHVREEVGRVSFRARLSYPTSKHCKPPDNCRFVVPEPSTLDHV